MPETVAVDTSASKDAADTRTEVRTGFWLRLFAMAIDGLIVSIVIQVIVAVLFFATSGRIQLYGDLNYTRCTVLPAVPGDLMPPKPPRTNFTRQCDITFFGAPTAKIVQVGEIVPGMKDKDGEPTRSLSKTSMLTSYTQIGARGVQWQSAISDYLFDLPGKVMFDGAVAHAKCCLMAPSAFPPSRCSLRSSRS